MKKNKKKILNGILIAMSCLLATGLVLQVTNVLDFTSLFEEEKNNSNKKIGTAVPNSGHVEKIYFNTELTNEEVESLVRKLEPTIELPGISGYVILSSEESSAGVFGTCMIMYKDDGIGIVWEDNDNEIPIFFTSPLLASEENVEPNGWQTFNNPIELNIDVVNESPNGFSVGTQNNLITSLVSITPFK